MTDADRDRDVPTQSLTPDDESTVGTGTALALGCLGGTLLLILIGAAFLVLNLVL